MFKCGDEIELNIEKLTYEGEALGRYFSDETPDGFVVFVKNAAPEDKLKVKITQVNKSYAKAQIIEIIEPSPHRKKPFCPLFNACGGCSYQYLEYNYLLEQKNNMLKEAFLKLDETKRPKFLEPIKSPKQEGYRHKIQYRVSETKNSKRLLVGYYREKSHEIVNIKFCLIQPALAGEMAQYLRDNWTLGAYVEKTCKGLLKSFVLRISDDLERVLVTLVLNCSANEFKKHEVAVNEFFVQMSKKFSQIKGCSVNFNPEKSNRVLGEEFRCVLGENYIYETLSATDDSEGTRDTAKKTYKISPSSFFQVNPSCAAKLFDEVKRNIEPDTTVLDAYGGVGAIGIWVSDKARKIYLVEENKSAVDDAKENFKLNNCKAYEVFLGDAKEQFKKFLKEKKKFGTVIIDPPRKGSDKEALEILSKLTDIIIYVSCNPQTLVRDIACLNELGFRAKTTRGADMFPYSYHIESVTVIESE